MVIAQLGDILVPALDMVIMRVFEMEGIGQNVIVFSFTSCQSSDQLITILSNLALGQSSYCAAEILWGAYGRLLCFEGSSGIAEL